MITELTLLSADIEGTANFYRQALQLPPLQQQTNEVAFMVGHTKLVFQQAAGIKPLYHFAINIPHNKLIEAYNWLGPRLPILEVAEGQPFARFMQWNAQSFYFFDNNGNLLELICRYDLPNSSPESFSASAMLGISEIGIATDRVNERYEQLQQQYKIPVFAKQPPAENFAAIGHEEALFILAQTGRPWYPTTIPAQPFYTRVVWQANGNTQTIVFE